MNTATSGAEALPIRDGDRFRSKSGHVYEVIEKMLFGGCVCLLDGLGPVVMTSRDMRQMERLPSASSTDKTLGEKQ